MVMAPRFGARQGDLRGPTRKKVARLRERNPRVRPRKGLYVNNRDYRNTIFLAGSGRSGTTWVSDVINYRDEYRYVFEPFHPGKVKTCKGFRRKQYLRPEDRREEFLRPARMILSGALKNHYWADLLDSRYIPVWRVRKDLRKNKTRDWAMHLDGRFATGRRLIKDIRVNLMLGWLRANFPGMPIVFLLRHPCAVVYSKMKLGWRPLLDDFLSQRELVEDFLEPFENEIRSVRTDFERHVFSWCVENYVPLKQLRRGEVYLAFYENLCEDPEGEVRRLFGFLNKYFNKDLIFEKIQKPSRLSREWSAIESGEKLVGGWRRHMTGAQLSRAVEILSLFGMDGVYSEEVMPDIEGAFALMGTYYGSVSTPLGRARTSQVS
jgi:hypothetical protein